MTRGGSIAPTLRTAVSSAAWPGSHDATASTAPRRRALQRRASPSDALVRLQQAAGNRAVGRVLARAPAASIAVHQGSKLTAKEFVNALKSNQKVPGWLKNGVSAKGDAIVLAGDLKPPSDKIWLFDESFAKAFKAGDWQITTAKATIEVTDKDDKLPGSRSSRPTSPPASSSATG